MSVHLKPETEARLEALAAACGFSADAYLEALVERELLLNGSAPADESDSGMIVEEHGLRVYRTGRCTPESLVNEAIRRAREARLADVLGILP